MGLFYIVITSSLSFVFPKQTFGNIIYLIIHLIICLVLIYFSFRTQSSKA